MTASERRTLRVRVMGLRKRIGCVAAIVIGEVHDRAVVEGPPRGLGG